MSYYRIWEVNPPDWVLTNELIVIGAVHCGTLLLGSTVYRKFVMEIPDDDPFFSYLKLSGRVEINPLDHSEKESLIAQGYIKRD